MKIRLITHDSDDDRVSLTVHDIVEFELNALDEAKNRQAFMKRMDEIYTMHRAREIVSAHLEFDV